MRALLVLLFAVAAVPVAQAQLAPAQPIALTRAIRIRYRAHDGVMRPAWLLLPANYDGRRIPLVISPHGRGVGAAQNALIWGDLPGEGNFAVINPGGEGDHLHWFSWGAPGQIADLARMPTIAAAHGVNVDPKRVYAIGGSMGGQETLLLVAEHPRLLAGAVAFDPATDMARRYRDFATLKHGAQLQALARAEVGGTPSEAPAAYARRSPDHYTARIAQSGVPLQVYWSPRDRVIADQRLEAASLVAHIRRDHLDERVWDFEGEWAHTAEMRADRRLPRALARFGLLPWREIPRLAATHVPSRAV
jgi:poly(3-hydroxybutyrate) depolymerase